MFYLVQPQGELSFGLISLNLCRPFDLINIESAKESFET